MQAIQKVVFLVSTCILQLIKARTFPFVFFFLILFFGHDAWHMGS